MSEKDKSSPNVQETTERSRWEDLGEHQEAGDEGTPVVPEVEEGSEEELVQEEAPEEKPVEESASPESGKAPEEEAETVEARRRRFKTTWRIIMNSNGVFTKDKAGQSRECAMKKKMRYFSDLEDWNGVDVEKLFSAYPNLTEQEKVMFAGKFGLTPEGEDLPEGWEERQEARNKFYDELMNRRPLGHWDSEEVVEEAETGEETIEPEADSEVSEGDKPAEKEARTEEAEGEETGAAVAVEEFIRDQFTDGKKAWTEKYTQCRRASELGYLLNIREERKWEPGEKVRIKGLIRYSLGKHNVEYVEYFCGKVDEIDGMSRRKRSEKIDELKAAVIRKEVMDLNYDRYIMLVSELRDYLTSKMKDPKSFSSFDQISEEEMERCIDIWQDSFPNKEDWEGVQIKGLLRGMNRLKSDSQRRKWLDDIARRLGLIFREE